MSTSPRLRTVARPLRHLALVLALLGPLAALVAGTRPASAANEQRVFVREIPDQATWLAYTKELGADRFGKFIIDIRTDEIYFIDVNVFRIHADFVLDVLLKLPWTAENIREYNRNYERVKPRFILGYLTHHQKVDRFTLAFWEGDKIDAPMIIRVRQRLAKSFYIRDLSYRPDSPAQEVVAKEVARRGLKIVTNDELYKSAPYQAFNKGATVGRLRVVPPGTAYESLQFDRGDIALLQESYPDISPVAGILATTFSTPLSHVNLRAAAWNIPNAGYRSAHKKYAQLDGQVVFYEVKDGEHTLRVATPEEVATHEAKVKDRTVIRLPEANLKEQRLAMLNHLRVADVSAYGAKTANLGEIVVGNRPGVHVPEGFGVPFAYYAHHMETNRLDERVAALLQDERWAADAAWRKQELKALREAIIAAPLDPKVSDALYKRVRVRLGGKGVFVRSSTNAEDLPGFNGAGLYDTVPNVRGRDNLGTAVKTVWASLWNQRAVDERDLFGIDHRSVYASVLIQVGVNATAAGVLVTANLYDPSDDDSFTINAKWGLGIRVVEGTRVPEQIIFDPSNNGTKIISRSDDATMLIFDEAGGIREVAVPSDGVILSEERAKRLADAVRAFLPLFSAEQALDIEWLLEGETIWIVQARPLVRHR